MNSVPSIETTLNTAHWLGRDRTSNNLDSENRDCDVILVGIGTVFYVEFTYLVRRTRRRLLWPKHVVIVIVIKVMLCSRRVYYVQLHTRQLTWMEILEQNKFGNCFGTLQASCLLWSNLWWHYRSLRYWTAEQNLNRGGKILYWNVLHSEDRASWYILIIKVNGMHYFSNLFW